MIVIIKQAPSFLCNDNCDSNRVSCDYPKHAQKAPFSCLQNPDGIVTPPLPLNAVVAQRGASLGIYQRKKNGQCRGDKSRSARPASIADGIPPAAENGRTRAPFWFAGKRLASNRPPFHIGRAVPTDFSAFAVK